MSRKSPETATKQSIRELRMTNEYNCATTCLRALLPHRPCPESVEAVYHNILSLEEIAAIILLEHFENGQPAICKPMLEEFPAHFFNCFVRQCNQAGSAYTFAGGLILSNRCNQNGQEIILHVITVTKIHRTKGGANATVIDTAFPNLGPKDIPLNRLNQLIMPLNHPHLVGREDFVRAVAISTSSLYLSKAFFDLLPTLEAKREELKHRAYGYYEEEKYWGTFLRKN